MRVLHLTVTIDRGGSENHLISLIEQQVNHNYQVSVVFLKGKPYWEKHLNSLGVKTYKIFLFSSIIQLIKIILRWKPIIFHAHLQTSEILSRLAILFFPKLKYFISKHNDEDSRFLPKFIHNNIYRIIAKRASKVIAISENVKTYCIEKLRIPEDKIQVIYYGIDSEIYKRLNINQNSIEKIKDELGIKKDDFVLGTIARLHPQKSLDTLINAIAELVIHKQLENIKLIIVGSGHLEHDLKNQVYSLGLKEKVIFTGKRNDIPVILNIFHVFVLCSIYEGLGLVLLEAMSAKVPVIGTKAGAIPEIIADCGLIVEPRNFDALALAILKIYNDVSLRKSLIEKSYYRVLNQFSLDQMFSNTHHIYLQS